MKKLFLVLMFSCAAWAPPKKGPAHQPTHPLTAGQLLQKVWKVFARVKKLTRDILPSIDYRAYAIEALSGNQDFSDAISALNVGLGNIHSAGKELRKALLSGTRHEIGGSLLNLHFHQTNENVNLEADVEADLKGLSDYASEIQNAAQTLSEKALNEIAEIQGRLALLGAESELVPAFNAMVLDPQQSQLQQKAPLAQKAPPASSERLAIQELLYLASLPGIDGVAQGTIDKLIAYRLGKRQSFMYSRWIYDGVFPKHDIGGWGAWSLVDETGRLLGRFRLSPQEGSLLYSLHQMSAQAQSPDLPPVPISQAQKSGWMLEEKAPPQF